MTGSRKAPASSGRSIDLPAMTPDLYPYQAEGSAWLSSRASGALTDEMGLGKTVQALDAARRVGAGAGLLVVCPAAVKGVWAAEAKTWRPELRVEILEGRGSFRWPRSGELVVVNYELLPPVLKRDGSRLRDRDRLFVRSCSTPAGPPPPGTILIADEAHLLKNPRAKRSRSFRVLRFQVVDNLGRAWALTGTPLAARPMDLWGVLVAFGLEQQAFGRDAWKTFRRCFRARKGRFGTLWDPKKIGPRPETPGLLRRVALKRRRDQVLADLPGKRYRRVPVYAGASIPWTREMLEGLEELRRGEEGKAKLDFETLSKTRRELAIAKIPALVELVEEHEESEEPLVVFSVHRPPVDELETRKGWAAIHGDTPAADRTRIVADYQAGRLLGVALTIGAGSTGLTLTRGASVVFVDRAWNPADNLQAEDRVCRIGQRRGVLVTTLVARHPVDERVDELLEEKLRLYRAADVSGATG